MMPFPISLDFSRDYKFLFQIFNVNSTISWDSLTDIASDLYISTLAKKIDLPDKEIFLEEAQISSLKIPFPTDYALSTFTVTFLEDSIGSVNRYFTKWQDLIRDRKGTFLSRDLPSVTYVELLKVTKSIMFSQTVSLGDVDIADSAVGLNIPVNPVIYPNVIPTRITRGTYDKSGSELALIQITFTRIPKISFESAS